MSFRRNEVLFKLGAQAERDGRETDGADSPGIIAVIRDGSAGHPPPSPI